MTQQATPPPGHQADAAEDNTFSRSGTALDNRLSLADDKVRSDDAADDTAAWTRG